MKKLFSAAFNRFEDVPFIDDCDNEKEKVQTMANMKRRKEFACRILIGLVIFLAILTAILFGWNLWLKPNDTKILQVVKREVAQLPLQIIESEMARKQQFVKEMMLHSWKGYVRYAWGHEAVRPVTKAQYDGLFGPNSGLTLVTSMSTLWIMGLKEEFNQAKQWVETELNLSKINKTVPISEVATHYIGGLLSCFALTNDTMFLNKSIEIAQLIEPAFNTSTGIPFLKINPKTGTPEGHNFASLTQISGFLPELTYLSDTSGKPQYRNNVNRILSSIKEAEKPKDLFLSTIHMDSSACTLDGLTSGFYNSLVKLVIQSDYRNVAPLKMYRCALDAAVAVGMIKTSPNGHYYVIRYNNIDTTDILERFKDFVNYSRFMKYDSCFLGALLSLGANVMKHALSISSRHSSHMKEHLERISFHWKLAEKITETCQLASVQTKTGLGPNDFYFNRTNDGIPSIFYRNNYNLSPELAESNFILWRLTHDPKYRAQAWQMAQAINQHCRVECGGFVGITDVDQLPALEDDRQFPFFLSATLKYLYLTLTDDDVLPLDEWFFNINGHPLPICGKNVAYPESLCKV